MSSTLILASSSPRRRELIARLGLPCEIMPSHADERVDPALPPAEIVETLSLRKARAVLGPVRRDGVGGVIVGSDTIVVQGRRVLGKPRDEQEAFAALQSLQGGTHQVYTGVACIETGTGRELTAHRMTRVTMKRMSPDQIKRYIASGEPLDKAGSFGIQGLGATLVEKIEGDYFAVVGLPLALLSDMLAEFGIDVLKERV